MFSIILNSGTYRAREKRKTENLFLKLFSQPFKCRKMTSFGLVSGTHLRVPGHKNIKFPC